MSGRLMGGWLRVTVGELTKRKDSAELNKRKDSAEIYKRKNSSISWVSVSAAQTV